ncbi:hypothetical protein I4U23_011668 [Adineta vaga]|nr:hypothetical protein I4U23_011668 [Adineta vaga]
MTLINFTVQSFEEKLNKQNTGQNKDVKLCRVELYLNYINSYLRVTFSPGLMKSELPNGVTQFDTIISKVNPPTNTLSNFLEYACSTDNCDKKFALAHIQWLLNAQYTTLHITVRSILLGNAVNSSEVNCFINDSSKVLCADEVCAVSHDNDETEYKQSCGNKDVEDTILQMTTYVDIAGNKLREETTLICQYNECNSRSIFSKILTAIKEKYDLKPMFRAFNMSIESNETATKTHSFTSSKLTTSTSKNETPPMHVISITYLVFGTFYLLVFLINFS